MRAIDAVHELERPIKITVESVESSRIIRIIGDVDTVTAPELDLTLSSLRAEKAENFYIDMQSVTYISSMGLRVFLSHLKKMRGSGSRMILCGASHLVTDIFRMSGFTSFFEMFENLDAAMAEY
jgi:anti-sigma B factor antagonist